jgi:hypothetical protein
MTGLLQLYKATDTSINEQTIQTIKEKKELSLDERLKHYNS